MTDIFGFCNPGGLTTVDPEMGPGSLRHPATGCVITADARIDYREALCRSLALESAPESDAELVLEAYLRWGERCVERLMGDFAFAIWDPRDRSLFCARDPFGMRPFYYHYAPGRRFAFASSARALFMVGDIPYRIHEARVADSLVPELEWIDYSSTFYEDVHRLPPGHKLVLTPGALDLTDYWPLAPGPSPGARSDGEWVDAFLEVLTRSVRERLRAPAGRAGCMLSGGMDSGSVAALARDLGLAQGTGPLPTFSAALEQDQQCDETRRILATIGALGANATVLRPDRIGDLDGELVASIEEPFDGEFHFMKAIYLAARNSGVAVVLDGGGGDVVLNEGSYVPRLIRQGRLASALREIRAEPSFWGGRTSPRDVARYLLKAFTPGPIKRSSRRYRRRLESRRFVSQSLISRGYSEQVGIEERCARMYELFSFDPTFDLAMERLQRIRPNVSAGRERYGRLAASAGVEPRDPFLDLNVVNFCVHLPGHLLLRNGWPKFILRLAMEGRLPEEVRWGPGKPHIGRAFTERFLQREMARGHLSLRRLQTTLGDRVDTIALTGAWESFLRTGGSEPINRAYVLSLWLEQAANRPVVKNQGFR